MKHVDCAFTRRTGHQMRFRVIHVRVHAVPDREGLANDFSIVRIHDNQELGVAASNE